MLKCTGCGRTFDELEHFTETHDGWYKEEWDGCPYCGESSPIEVETCDGCHEDYDVNDLYHGYCEDCLRRLCTYDTALDYLEGTDKLGQFFCWVLNEGHEPDKFALDLLDAFKDLYRRYKANDLITDTHEWLDAIQEYILDADGDYGKDDFAKFLEDTEV